MGTGLFYSALEKLWDHDVINLNVVDSIRCMPFPFMGVLVVFQCVCQYKVVIGGSRWLQMNSSSLSPPLLVLGLRAVPQVPFQSDCASVPTLAFQSP